MPPPGSSFAAHWDFEPGVTFLNHGSFGACPRALLEHQQRLRARLESQPVRFLARELFEEIDLARIELAEFLGCSSEDVVFVPNATTGVNAVLQSFPLAPGDELLTTNHDYNACRNALHLAAARAGAEVKIAHIPFPLSSPAEAHAAVMAAVTERTRLVLLDHITSPTALVLPVETLVPELEALGVAVALDAAHAPGQVELDLGTLRPSYATGNLHKWLCAPKGCAFLYAREDGREELRPPVVSHGENMRRPGRSHFHDRFDWCGTLDPTAWLCAGEAIRWCDGLVAGGLPALRAHNHALALAARGLIAGALGVPLPCPDSMIGSMAAIPLPANSGWSWGGKRYDAQQAALWDRHRIEVPIMRRGPDSPRCVRISAQIYNDRAQYEFLAAALLEPPPAQGAG